MKTPASVQRLSLPSTPDNATCRSLPRVWHARACRQRLSPPRGAASPQAAVYCSPLPTRRTHVSSTCLARTRVSPVPQYPPRRSESLSCRMLLSMPSRSRRAAVRDASSSRMRDSVCVRGADMSDTANCGAGTNRAAISRVRCGGYVRHCRLCGSVSSSEAGWGCHGCRHTSHAHANTHAAQPALTLATLLGGRCATLIRPSSSTMRSSTRSASSLSVMLSDSCAADRSSAAISRSMAPICAGSTLKCFRNGS